MYVLFPYITAPNIPTITVIPVHFDFVETFVWSPRGSLFIIQIVFCFENIKIFNVRDRFRDRVWIKE